MLKYFLGIFPVLAIASVAAGNPYFTLILLAIACIIAVPVSYVACKNIVQRRDMRWSIVSLVCSSTAAFMGLLGFLVFAESWLT